MKFKILNHYSNFYNVEDEYGNTKKLALNRKFNIFVGNTSISLSHHDIWEIVSMTDTELELKEAVIEVAEDGYLIYKNSIKDEYVHRMVVFLFGDINGKTLESFKEIDHLDGNKQRNIPENLEFVPRIVNLYRAYKNGYAGSEKRIIEYLEEKIENKKVFKNIIKDLYEEVSKDD